MDLVGRKIGNHRILSFIGEGGMGAVYLAEHVVIGRQDAIKVLNDPSGANPLAVQRFFDEARAANRVRHPGIVDIYDCGHDPGIGPYLVMEFLAGESLGRSIRRGDRLSIGKVVRIVAEVADVLGAVHAQGIVHRDLKPDNIFLLADGRIKVLDFGVALLAGRSPADSSASGLAIMGTPIYMAPEQCWGEGADFRTDIYALGVIAYELLAGAPPFSNVEMRQVLAMHLYEPPPRLSGRNPEITPALERAVLRALDKQPSARFASIGEFAAALLEAAEVCPEPRSPSQAGALPEPGSAAAMETAPARVIEKIWERGCPACPEQQMSPVTFGDVVLDVCPRCNGVWFDPGEEEEIAHQSLAGGQRPFAELAAELGERLRVTPMRCPYCSDPLVTYCFAHLERLEADLCEFCGGLWLEKGELAQIQRSRARQVFEQMGAKCNIRRRPLTDRFRARKGLYRAKEGRTRGRD